ncbi:MAG: hypothetical protein LW835_17970, partial [Burkholderiaceae bacterium]|nr:hypothetical protein [Burkholderiaceae bacterium]
QRSERPAAARHRCSGARAVTLVSPLPSRTLGTRKDEFAARQRRYASRQTMRIALERVRHREQIA